MRSYHLNSGMRGRGQVQEHTGDFIIPGMTMYDGLDGIAIDFPALDITPTHGEYYPLNIKVKDPLWPNRSMIDVSFSVKPGEPHTLYLDTRDRILPENHSLYITFAGAGDDFGPGVLEGTEIRLIFKKRLPMRLPSMKSTVLLRFVIISAQI